MTGPSGSREQQHSLGPAFNEKCQREREKLYAVLTGILQDDIKDLLSTGTEADITVHFKEGQVTFHGCFVNARLPDLWSALGDTAARSRIQDVTSIATFQQIIRHIYTVDDLSPIKEQVDALITSLTKCSEEITATIKTESALENGQLINGPPSETPPDANIGQTTNLETTVSHGMDLSTSSPNSNHGNTTENCKNDASTPTSEPVSGCHGPDESYCTLGADLLTLYHTQAGSNVKVKVRDTTLSLHRCMLYARSPYFAAMLGGQWKESAARQINLEGINADAMRRALVYMYGGLPELAAEGSNLTELVTIADMYGLHGLKHIITFHFKRNCHFFHKPCADCVPAVLSCMPLAHMFCLDDLYDKALKWCAKYISRVWTAKPFAGLPSEIQDACLHSAMANITNDTVVSMVMECDKLAGSLTNVRWSEPVTVMASQLMDSCIDHLKNHFVHFTKTQKFLSLGKTMALGLGFLSDLFSRAIITMPTSKACATYARVHQLRMMADQEDSDWTEDFKQMVRDLEEKCEHFLRLYINQLINTEEWNSLLSQHLQDRIKDGAWYVCVGDGRRLRGPPRMVGYQVPQDLASNGTNQSQKSARPKNPIASGSHLSKKPRTEKLTHITSKELKSEPNSSSSQLPGPSSKTKNAKAKHSSLPRPDRKPATKTKASSSSGSKTLGPDSKMFKTVKQEGASEENARSDSFPRSPTRPPTIKPIVRKTSTTSTSPDAWSRISSTSSTGGATSPVSYVMAQNTSHLKCMRLETMSNMSYPSNAATISDNSSLSTPTSDFGGMGDGSASVTSGSDVFASPEREGQPPMGGPIAMATPPTIHNIISEREGIRFFVRSCVSLNWVFVLPQQ